jgi:hypothetical protein
MTLGIVATLSACSCVAYIYQITIGPKGAKALIRKQE